MAQVVAFLESRYNANDIVYETAGGPGYSTTVISMQNGAEVRNQNWANARGKWDVGERIVHETELAYIIQFFRSTKGKAFGFRFKDWGDHTASTAEGVVALISGNQYQLYKKYRETAPNADYSEELRKITKPAIYSPNFQLFKNSVLVPGANYTLNYNTGVITWTTSPPSGGDTVQWSGDFDVPVRFDTDELKYQFSAMETQGGVVRKLFQLYSTPIVEVVQ